MTTRAALLVTFALTAAACTTSFDGPFACDSDSDCRQGSICSARVCQEGDRPKLSLSLSAAAALVPTAGTVQLGALDAAGAPLAQTAVRWEVIAGGAGGTVDASGLYRAATQAGVDTVRASLVVDPTIAAVATVAAVDRAIHAPSTVSAHKTALAASTAAVTGVSFHWSVAGGTLVAGDGTAAISFGSGEEGTLTLGCTARDAAGNALDLTPQQVAVIALPALPVLQAAAVVAPGSATASVASPDPSWTYHWTIAGGAFIGSPDQTSVSYSISAAVGQMVTLGCTATNAVGDAGPSATLSETVASGASKPNPPVVATSTVVTAGKALHASVSSPDPSLSYRWTLTGGNFTGASTGSAVDFALDAPGAAQLGCIASNEAGDSVPTVMNLTALALPAAPALVPLAYATSGSSTVTAAVSAPDAALTYAWTAGAGASISGAANGTSVTLHITAAAGATVSIGCTASNAAHDAGPAAALSPAVVALPAAPALTARSKVTSGKSEPVSVPALAGVSYRFTITADGGPLTTLNGSSGSYTPTGSSIGLSVAGTNLAGDAGPATTATAQVYAAAVAPTLIAPDQASAGGADFTAQVSAPAAGASYAWTANGATFPAGSMGSSVTVHVTAAGGSVSVTCTPTNAAGDAGPPASKTIALLALPAAPTLAALTYVTSGGTATASVSAPDAALTYAWTASAGATISGAASGTSVSLHITAAAGANVTVGCAARNLAGDASAATTLTPAVVALPAAPALTARSQVTSGRTETVSVPALGGITYHFVVTAAGTQLTQFTANSGSYLPSGSSVTVTAAGTNLAGDTGATSTVTAQVFAPAPTPTLSAPGYASSGGADFTAQVSSPDGSTTYVWTATGATFPSGNTGSAVAVHTTAGAGGTITLTCTPKNGAGDSSSAGSRMVSVLSLPGAPALAGPTYVTANSTALSASVGSPDSSLTYAWTASGATITSAASGTSITLHVTGAVGTAIEISCTAKNLAGDSGSAGLLAPAVVALPAAPGLTARAKVTSGALEPVSVPGTAGVSYHWTVTSGGNPLAQFDGDSGSYTPSGSSVSVGCAGTNLAGDTGPASSVTAQVYAVAPTPSLTAPPYASEAGSDFSAAVSAPDANTTYSWSAAGATFPNGATGAGVTVHTTGAAGSMVALSCTPHNGAGDAGTPGSKSVSVVALPTVPTLYTQGFALRSQPGASAAIVTPHAGWTYSWSVTNAAASSPTTGTAFTFTPIRSAVAPSAPSP